MARIDFTNLKTALDNSNSITLILPSRPVFDEVAATLSLALALENQKKTVSIICPDPMTAEFSRLIDITRVGQNISSQRSLIIGFSNQTENVDKVSYNLDHGELQLVITPKPQAPDLDYRKLSYLVSAGQPDLIIIVGADRLSDLSQIATDNKDLFTKSKVCSITLDQPSENYASIELFDPDASSLCELFTRMFENMSFTFTPDISTNLFSGLKISTQNFQDSIVSASTFETAAFLLRHGANRQLDQVQAENFPQGAIPQSNLSTTSQTEIPVSQPNQTPILDNKTQQPPAEWLEPKVFSGPTV